jgi:branched-chain amino acid aminotransferase
VETRISVDGRITRPEEAVVPALDRGFLYGDSVYEVVWWHRGVLIQRQEHLDRLRGSAAHLYMEITASDEALLAAVDATIAATGVTHDEDAYVRLMVTRGTGALGLAVQPEERHCVVVVVAPANRPSPEGWERGLTMIVGSRRRNPRVALDPQAKTGNYLNNVLALHEAHLAGADDAIMLNEAGEVTEATTANVYVVREGRLCTPSLEAGILRGTTRTRILALSARHGLDAEEGVLRQADLDAADEVFVSSSVRGILPVLAIDGRPVGDGRPGPVTRRIRTWFEEAADEEARSTARHLRG